jgi:hypothetical protein
LITSHYIDHSPGYHRVEPNIGCAMHEPSDLADPINLLELP